MTDKIKIRLSTEEICVIAGLLGYKSVVGIENEMPDKWKSSLRHRIRTVVKRLEKKRILRCGLEGRLLLGKTVRMAVECLCKPEIILIVTDTSQKASDVKRYIMRKNGRYFMLGRTSNGSCNICISEVFDFEIFKKRTNANIQNIDVSYQIQKIRKAKNALDSFDEERARMLLSDDGKYPQSAEAILEVLGNDFVSLDVFSQNHCICKKFFSRNIGFCNDTAVEITVDDETVRFRNVDTTATENTLRDIFERKEGVLI